MGGSGDPFLLVQESPCSLWGVASWGALELLFELISLGEPGPGPGLQEVRTCVSRP